MSYGMVRVETQDGAKRVWPEIGPHYDGYKGDVFFESQAECDAVWNEALELWSRWPAMSPQEQTGYRLEVERQNRNHVSEAADRVRAIRSKIDPVAKQMVRLLEDLPPIYWLWALAEVTSSAIMDDMLGKEEGIVQSEHLHRMVLAKLDGKQLPILARW